MSTDTEYPIPSVPATVLNDAAILGLMEGSEPRLRGDRRRVQPASIDLAFSPDAVIREISGVPPGVMQGLTVGQMVTQRTMNSYRIGDHPTLHPGITYIVELDVDLALLGDVHGECNPKSTSGRLNLWCLVTTENFDGFNHIPCGYRGKLYLILVPGLWPVKINEHESLVQLRLFRGRRVFISGGELEEMHRRRPLVYGVEKPIFVEEGLVLHLDLAGDIPWAVGKATGEPIDLSRREHYPADSFFERKPNDRNGALHLEHRQVLLALTRERIAVYPGLSGQITPNNERFGRFDAHDAGFVDPGYGLHNGARITCEVQNGTTRGAPVFFFDGQQVAIMRCEKLIDCPAEAYGTTTDRVEGAHYVGRAGVDRLLPKQFAVGR